MLSDNNYNEKIEAENPFSETTSDVSVTEDILEKESMPDMLDVIWEAEDLGIQGGFMYYYPEAEDT